MATQAWNAAAVYAAEAAVMAELPEGELMRRAVSALADRVEARLTGLSAERGRPLRVVGLVGPGNNGADAGFALAELSTRLSPTVLGEVSVVRLAPSLHAGAEAALNSSGLAVVPASHASEVLDQADVVLDGIVGLGGRLGLSATAARVVDAIPSQAWVVAVDLPSGVPADGEWADDANGQDVTAQCVVANETVTFGVMKPAHLGAYRAVCGQVSLVDIGVRPHHTPTALALTGEDLRPLWPVPDDHDNKYSRGVVGLVAGSSAYPGAAVLAAVGAGEAGAGMIRIITSPEARVALFSQVPEAVVSTPHDTELLGCQAWVVGPGLVPSSPDDHSLMAYARRVLDSDLPCVVDAGGLSLVQGPRSGPTLLTPHAGELASLASRVLDVSSTVTSAMVRERPLYWARAVASTLHATVLLKGSVTYVIPSDQEPRQATLVSAVAPAWLATAGAGDVLAGVCGVLLAGGVDVPTAGALAATATGLAAHAANPGGPVRALRVALALPRVIGTGLTHAKDDYV